MSIFKAVRSYFSLTKKEFMFTDTVSGLAVYSFTDCYGDKWMKDSRWGFFSVKN